LDVVSVKLTISQNQLHCFINFPTMKFYTGLLFGVFVSSASGFVSTSTSTSSRPRTRLEPLQAYQTVAEAIAEAQHICAQDPNSEACRVAWDIVEELEATDSHFRSSPGKFTPLEAARGGGAIPPTPPPRPINNDIATAKDIQALLAGYDILARKMDPKLDNLVATTEKLMELGADDPAVAELQQRAYEMKRLIHYVYDYLARQ
jgi:CP12 domain